MYQPTDPIFRFVADISDVSLDCDRLKPELHQEITDLNGHAYFDIK